VWGGVERERGRVYKGYGEW
jgi:hypothetical protein